MTIWCFVYSLRVRSETAVLRISGSPSFSVFLRGPLRDIYRPETDETRHTDDTENLTRGLLLGQRPTCFEPETGIVTSNYAPWILSMSDISKQE
jgi:hypothetical protein